MAPVRPHGLTVLCDDVGLVASVFGPPQGGQGGIDTNRPHSLCGGGIGVISGVRRPKDGVVLLKGRMACELSSADEARRLLPRR